MKYEADFKFFHSKKKKKLQRPDYNIADLVVDFIVWAFGQYGAYGDEQKFIGRVYAASVLGKALLEKGETSVQRSGKDPE